ncbi:hypothetical protein ElyMa_004466400 [Elysia marginata]|uniref:Uncharacterized protein n=1 Tax=Elysia marginata TaxID=1093978 RepID=A0AAV4HH79_9GAST|nr:hypothetical protein ElyMa_004466400 [Elysia marginata]
MNSKNFRLKKTTVEEEEKEEQQQQQQREGEKGKREEKEVEKSALPLSIAMMIIDVSSPNANRPVKNAKFIITMSIILHYHTQLSEVEIETKDQPLDRSIQGGLGIRCL